MLHYASATLFNVNVFRLLRRSGSVPLTFHFADFPLHVENLENENLEIAHFVIESLHVLTICSIFAGEHQQHMDAAAARLQRVLPILP